MLGLKLNHASKRGPWSDADTVDNLYLYVDAFKRPYIPIVDLNNNISVTMCVEAV